MPQAKNKPADAPKEPTQKEIRERERRAKAEAAAAGYEPREGAAFDGSRGYVSAQFDIAVETQERYTKVLEDRKEVRDILGSLHNQRLMTPDEVVLMFEMFPKREDPKESEQANGQQAATQPAAA